MFAETGISGSPGLIRYIRQFPGVPVKDRQKLKVTAYIPLFFGRLAVNKNKGKMGHLDKLPSLIRKRLVLSPIPQPSEHPATLCGSFRPSGFSFFLSFHPFSPFKQMAGSNLPPNI